MADMCLSNKDEFPEDAVMARHLGKRKKYWDDFLAFIAEFDPDIAPEWRYYNDGKSWLCKVARKKKTLAWVSVYPGLFKVAFYFTDKAAELLSGSKLDKKYLDQFREGRYIGKLRAVVVEVTSKKALEQAKILLDVKKKAK